MKQERSISMFNFSQEQKFAYPEDRVQRNAIESNKIFTESNFLNVPSLSQITKWSNHLCCINRENDAISSSICISHSECDINILD